METVTRFVAQDMSRPRSGQWNDIGEYPDRNAARAETVAWRVIERTDKIVAQG